MHPLAYGGVVASWEDVRAVASTLRETCENTTPGDAQLLVTAWPARASKRPAQAYLNALP